MNEEAFLFETAQQSASFKKGACAQQLTGLIIFIEYLDLLSFGLLNLGRF